MSGTAAIEQINDPGLRQQLSDFINTLKMHSDENLKSAILFGGVAKGDYTKGKSNTNVLLVFEKIDLEVLDQLAVPFQLVNKVKKV
jgi:predicted nucleotidyltransferase